jgi:putative AlgH/UPF0301 family transcriptional regulator
MDEPSVDEAWVEQSLTGRLLVASPELGDPNFARTVVLLVDHDESGALGVVLNRPSTTDVSEILPDWHLYTTPPQVVFQGGPVGRDSALALAARAGGKGEENEPLGFRHVHGGIGLVDLDAPAELVAGEVTSMRVFAGYAGWGSTPDRGSSCPQTRTTSPMTTRSDCGSGCCAASRRGWPWWPPSPTTLRSTDV